MIPIIQKICSSEEAKTRGDCLRACVCSLLEISDIGVPNFVEDKNYPEKLLETLSKFGYEIYHSESAYPADTYYMAWGTSPRGTYHSVICKDGEFIHDPHPDGGWVKNINRYVWLEPM